MASTRSRSLGPVADRVFVANVRKHGVTFEEAMTVFLDELAVPFEEGAHSRRWNILLFVLTARTGAAATPFAVRRADRQTTRRGRAINGSWGVFDRRTPRSTAGAMTPARATFSSPR